MKRMLLTLGLTAAQAGCVHAGASMYASGEVAPQGYASQGYEQPASAAYGIPSNAPKGTAYIVSLGGEQLPVNNGTGFFMHVRIAAENDGDTATWRFDPNEQALRFEGANAPEPAAFAEASTGGPVLTLARGQRGQLDLYYALPAQGGPQRTTLEWHVRRGDEPLAYATSFERPAGAVAEDGGAYYEPVYDARLHFAFGPGWWWGYDYWPFYYGFYAPFYRPWWGPRFYGYGHYGYRGYYAPRGYYHAPARSYGGSRGYSAPSAHVGRGGFHRR